MLSDPSAIALIVGAIAIVGFLVHGLWFSGRPTNRKLNAKNHDDEQLLKQSDVAKVRIVSRDRPVFKKEPAGESRSVPESSVEIREMSKAGGESAAAEENTFPSSVELNLVAPADHPYHGEDIEALCRQYGILRGDLDIFYVYENLQTRSDEVFRLCSLVSPFSFPQDMSSFTTPALALYMNVPRPGKAVTYVRALTMAARVFAENLGGEIRDIHHHLMTEERLQALEKTLQRYDGMADGEKMA